MATQLAPAGHHLITLANYQRVDVTRFQHDATDDRSALAALIEHELYGHNHAGGEPGDDPTRHGPYWRDRITVDSFEPVDAAAAERQLRRWANGTAELDREVYGPLRVAKSVYRLRELADHAVHDWGWVLWDFQEFVLAGDGTLTLVVAAVD
ncbi:hypothetical protein LFM09_23050 [Lentzea alba]|uniref:hypothetical protein n=1 Tax=Lentzea alba TaxID=2714351 RepID=UPI0039BF5DAF